MSIDVQEVIRGERRERTDAETEALKVRENQLRRKAKALGLKLYKSRSRSLVGIYYCLEPVNPTVTQHLPTWWAHKFGGENEALGRVERHLERVAKRGWVPKLVAG